MATLRMSSGSLFGLFLCGASPALLPSLLPALAAAAPPQKAAPSVAKFRPPLAERCANKDDARGLPDPGTELWGLRRSGTTALPLFLQASLEAVQLIDGRTLNFALRGARLLQQEPTVVGTTPAPAAANGDASSFIGAVITAVAPGGDPVELTICDAAPDSVDSELWNYNIQYYNSTAKRWQNVCVGTPDKPAPRAIALAGVWDAKGAHRDVANAFTFACPRGSLARCAQWGYKPWKKQSDHALGDYHQACTRLTRADYCGNGRSHTVEGHPIEVFDDLGIQNAAARSNQIFEAAWTPEGAYCVNRLRSDASVSTLLKECPGRFVAETTLGLSDGETCKLRAIKPAQILIRNRSLRKGR